MAALAAASSEGTDDIFGAYVILACRLPTRAPRQRHASHVLPAGPCWHARAHTHVHRERDAQSRACVGRICLLPHNMCRQTENTPTRIFAFTVACDVPRSHRTNGRAHTQSRGSHSVRSGRGCRQSSRSDARQVLHRATPPFLSWLLHTSRAFAYRSPASIHCRSEVRSPVTTPLCSAARPFLATECVLHPPSVCTSLSLPRSLLPSLLSKTSC